MYRADVIRIIFQLYLDSLPWTTGGEYLRFYHLVRRMIESFRQVGLEPTFVFDGEQLLNGILMFSLMDRLYTCGEARYNP